MFKKKHKKHTQSKTVDRSNIYTTGQIGRTREVTPEGYLLCRDVPIARTGTLMYMDGEVPVTADDTGLIIIHRGDDDLFRSETIASFEGKAITDDHPDDWVNPENWKQLAVGTAQNVRRGTDIDSEYLIADLLVTDKDAIQAVTGGKVEISLGYDAEYTEISKGKGVQSNIVGNHVALVEKGRCGSRCSIGDSFMPKKKISFADRIRNLVKTKDADEAEKLAKAVEDEDIDVDTEDDEPDEEKTKTGDAAFQAEMRKFMKTMDSRLSALEKGKTKDGDDDPEKKTDDDDPEKTEDDILKAEAAEKLSDQGVQKHTGDSLAEVRARAEILSPGIHLPTLDAAAKDIGKTVTSFKRQALKQAYLTADGHAAITPFINGNTNFDTMPLLTLDTAFTGASELIKQKNNASGVRSGISTKDFGRAPTSVSDINARNREFWANRGK